MNYPIRIAHIVGKMGSGGVEAVIMNYFRYIDKNKVQFDFIVDEGSTLPCRKEIESLGGRVIVVPPYEKIIEYLKELKKVFNANNYSIVHSHINTLSVFPLYMAKKCDIQVRIAHNHSIAGKSEWKKNIMKYILRPFSKVFSTDHYACTEFAGNWLFGKKAFKKGVIINNAIDVEKFKYDAYTRKDLRKEFGIEHKFVIGHVGRFVEVKNQEFIVNIFNEIQKIKESTLIFIGDKYGSTQEKIKRKVKELKLENKVIFLPPRNDIYRVYQAFDLFLFPSLHEGFGMALIEAQVAGLPCIASDTVPQCTKICNLVTFLSLDNDVHYWAKKCLELSDIKRESHVDEAKERGFDISIEAKKLEQMYINYVMKGAPEQ